MVKALICFLIVIIGIIIIWIVNTYNRFQYNLIKLNKGETNIKNALNNKYQVLVRYIDFLKENIKLEEDSFNSFLNLNMKSISSIKLNKAIDDCNNEIKGYLDDNEKLLKKETLININKELLSLNVTINGCKKFYNNTLVTYNKLVHCFPSKYVAKIYKFHEKEFYSEEEIEHFKILDN